jgi:hypothetical protein
MSKHANNQEAWAYAKKKYHLSVAVLEMAKEQGLNPEKFDKLVNHKQEPWKEPLPDFIRTLYEKRFATNQKADKSKNELFADFDKYYVSTNSSRNSNLKRLHEETKNVTKG